MKDKRKIELREWMWGIPVVLQLIFLTFYEYVYYYTYINSDMASDFILASTMSKSGELFLCKDWHYATEVHFLHTQILDSFLFKFTNNYRLVITISFFIFTMLITICCFTLIYKLTGSKKYAFLGVFLTITPCGIYYILGFRTQSYIAYILFSYIFLCLYISLIHELNVKKKYIICFFIIVLSFLMGCCGFRYLPIMILPLIACELWAMLRDNLFSEIFKLNKFSLCRIIMVAIPSLIGFCVYEYFILKNYGPFGIENAQLNDGADVLKNIIYTPLALLDVFGGFDRVGYDILSKDGFLQLVVIFNLFIMYSVVAFSFCKNNSKALNEKITLFRLFAVFELLIFVFLLSFTSMGTYGGRVLDRNYLFLGVFSVFALYMVILSQVKFNKVIKCFCIFMVFVFVVINDYKLIDTEREAKPEWVVVLEETGLTFGYAEDFWLANYTIALTNEEVEVATFWGANNMYGWATKRSYRYREPEFVVLHQESESVSDLLPDAKTELLYYDGNDIAIYRIISDN